MSVTIMSCELVKLPDGTYELLTRGQEGIQSFSSELKLKVLRQIINSLPEMLGLTDNILGTAATKNYVKEWSDAINDTPPKSNTRRKS